MAKKKTSEIHETVMDLLRDGDLMWATDSLWSDAPSIRIYASGEVWACGLGRLPFDWSETRSIKRAFAKRHRAMTLELAREAWSARRIAKERAVN